MSSSSNRAATWSGVSRRVLTALVWAPRARRVAAACSMFRCTKQCSGVFPSCVVEWWVIQVL